MEGSGGGSATGRGEGRSSAIRRRGGECNGKSWEGRVSLEEKG